MSQASLDYQSASPSSRWAPMLSKRGNGTIGANPTIREPAKGGMEQLMQIQLYGEPEKGQWNSWCKASCKGTCRVTSAATSPWALQHCRLPPFMLGWSCSRGCAKTWISKLRREKVQAEFKLTVPQELRWAPGWMEDGMEPEQPCSGQRSRQWLKHSWFLMKPLCRAGGWMEEQHRGIDQASTGISTGTLGHATLGSHLLSLLGLWGRKEEFYFPLSLFLKNLSLFMGKITKEHFYLKLQAELYETFRLHFSVKSNKSICKWHSCSV